MTFGRRHVFLAVLLVLLPVMAFSGEDTWTPYTSGLTGGTYAGYPMIVSSEFGYMIGPFVVKAEVGLGAFKFDLGYGYRQQRDSAGELPFTRGFSVCLSILDTWFLAPVRESVALGFEIRAHYNLFSIKTGYFFATDSADPNIFYIAGGVTL